MAAGLHNLAALLQAQGKHEEADRLQTWVSVFSRYFPLPGIIAVAFFFLLFIIYFSSIYYIYSSES